MTTLTFVSRAAIILSCLTLLWGCDEDMPKATPKADQGTIDPSADQAPDLNDGPTKEMGQADMRPPKDLGADQGADQGGAINAVIRGRFESTGPIRSCDQLAQWESPGGVLLRPNFDICGDDMAALARTIVANLDNVQARGDRALLIIGQGGFIPASWVEQCESFKLDDPRFDQSTCVPWDATYQDNLRKALNEHIGPAVKGHPALAGVYFTITTMTNGSELHFRMERSQFPYPGEQSFQEAYFKVMDMYQDAFEVPILFEAGHCIFQDAPGGAQEPIDCETPLALYRHAKTRDGLDNVGISLWNCAERFWTGPGSEGAGVRELLEEATKDGVSIGCQTVGSFTHGACRFSDADVADYGYKPPGPGSDNCPASDSFNPEAACVDTMNWFTGKSSRNPNSVVIKGTWAESWSIDVKAEGIYQTSPLCKAAIDALAP